MKVVDLLLRSVDGFQQRSRVTSFMFGVVKKFGDDNCGALSAQLAFHGVLSLFPLLLITVTVLGMVVGSSSSLTAVVLHSALAQIPIIGHQLGNNIHAIRNGSSVGIVVGIAGLAWGSQGIGQAGQYAMAEVWNVPTSQRPNFAARLGRTVGLDLVLGVFVLASTGMAAFSSSGISHSIVESIIGVILSVLLNSALYLLVFRVLTPKSVGIPLLYPGAVVGGVLWTVLQLLGSYLIAHQLRNTSQIYGFFAIVLGLLSWLYLGARISLYAAEVNVVKAFHLWPRSMVQTSHTDADRRAGQRQSQERVEGEGP